MPVHNKKYLNEMTIETMNLKLIPCDTEILNLAIQGNKFIAKKLNVTVQDNWTEFGIGPFKKSMTLTMD